MHAAKALGYRVGLHSAGIYPRRFAQVLQFADWVGFDAKAPFDAAYDGVTGVRASGAAALASARMLLASGKEHEFRTTWDSRLLAAGELERLSESLAALGAQSYVLQERRDGASVGGSGQVWASAALLERLAARFPRFSVRRA